MTVTPNRRNQSRTQLMAAVTRVPTAATGSRRAKRSRRRVTAMRLFCTVVMEGMVHAAVAALAFGCVKIGVSSLAFFPLQLLQFVFSMWILKAFNDEVPRCILAYCQGFLAFCPQTGNDQEFNRRTIESTSFQWCTNRFEWWATMASLI